MRRIILSLLVALSFVVGQHPRLALADIGMLTGTVTITGTGVSQPVLLAGQTSCNFTVSGTFSSLATTTQVATDSGFQNWVTATSIGSSGSITGSGVVGGVITTTTAPVPSALRFNTGTFTGTSAIVSYVCGGSAGSVPNPLPVTQPTGSLLHTVCDSGCGSPATELVMNCTAASANTLACTNSAGSTVCVNNAATQTCTVTGTSVLYGYQNNSGATEPAGFNCYNSVSTTPAAGALLLASPSGAPMGPQQILSVPGSAGVTAANITCVVAGGTALLNAGGVEVWYH